MKYLLHMSLVAGLLLSTSCKKKEEKKEETAAKTEEVAKAKPEDMLAQNWGVSDVQMEFLDPEMKKMAEKSKDKMNKELDEMKKNFFFNFSKDGSYVIGGDKKGKDEKGKWSIANGNVLITQADGKEKADSVNITILEDAKVVLVKGDDMSKITFTLVKK